MMVTMINKVTCWNLEYETDLGGARPLYSRVTKHHHGVAVVSWSVALALVRSSSTCQTVLLLWRRDLFTTWSDFSVEIKSGMKIILNNEQ